MEIGKKIIWRLAGHTMCEKVFCGKVLKVPGNDDGGFAGDGCREDMSIVGIR